MFEDYRKKIYKNRWKAEIEVSELHGGVPLNPEVHEAWIRRNLGEASEAQIQQMLERTMAETAISREEAIKQVAALKGLNGFKRFESGELYIEGRQVKAMLREAASVGVASEVISPRGWGKTNKGIISYLNEHIVVVEQQIGLGVKEPDPKPHQRFVSTWRGTGIQLEETVTDARLAFHVVSDSDWPEDFWPTVWVLAENLGVGASRSLGFGRFRILEWEQLPPA